MFIYKEKILRYNLENAAFMLSVNVCFNKVKPKKEFIFPIQNLYPKRWREFFRLCVALKVKICRFYLAEFFGVEMMYLQ